MINQFIPDDFRLFFICNDISFAHNKTESSKFVRGREPYISTFPNFGHFSRRKWKWPLEEKMPWQKREEKKFISQDVFRVIFISFGRKCSKFKKVRVYAFFIFRKFTWFLFITGKMRCRLEMKNENFIRHKLIEHLEWL